MVGVRPFLYWRPRPFKSTQERSCLVMVKSGVQGGFGGLWFPFYLIQEHSCEWVRPPWKEITPELANVLVLDLSRMKVAKVQSQP